MKETAKRRRVDWEAIERDYRTGRFTLRELEAKHGVDNASIARKKKAAGWQQDLSEAVRQATNAKLIGEIVDSEVSKAQQDVSTAVLAAAEVNKRVILGQRAGLARLQADIELAAAKVVELAATASDLREAAVLAQAVESVGRSMQRLHDGQRKAFGIDDAAAPGSGEDGFTEVVRRIKQARASGVRTFLKPGDISVMDIDDGEPN